MSSLSSSQRRTRRKRHAFWYRTFSGCLLLFVLSCAIAGMIVGLAISLVYLRQMFGLSISWFVRSVARSAWDNTLATVFVGAFVGLAVFVIVAVASGRWSARRKWRFAHSLKMGFFVPLTVAIIVIPAIITLCWVLYYRGLSSNGWQLYLMSAEFWVILLVPVPLIARLMHLSKSRLSKKPTPFQKPVISERLLPLD